MASVQKSMRIPEEMAAEIQNIAQRSGKDFSTITKELLEEAIKMNRCPGICFTEGVDGRRARIAGSGIEVWEIIQNFKSLEEDFSRLRTACHWLTEQQLRAAIAYYRSYPLEIEKLISLNESWSKDNALRQYPFLSGSAI